jgi:3-dehydrosphinganine reductase
MKLHNIGVALVFPPDTQTAQLEYENKIKPAETKALAGNTSVMTAEDVATEIIRGIERGKYIILPGLESKLIYRLNSIVGGGLRYYMDQVVAKASKRTNSSKTKEA